MLIARHSECNMLMQEQYRKTSFSELALHNYCYHGLRCMPRENATIKIMLREIIKELFRFKFKFIRKFGTYKLCCTTARS